MNRFTETNWHRLIKQFQPTGFCIISACRKEATPEENKEKTEELYKELTNKGLRPIKCVGGWIEDEGTENEHFVNETSFFVPFFFGNKSFSASEYDKKSTHIFFKWMFDLGQGYKQESILYCPPNGKPRYVQTTEKNYGEGPIKPGTHHDKFNGIRHNDLKSPYYTDLVHPKHQNGYNHETGKFSKVARRFTFEGKEILAGFKRICEAEESKNDILHTSYILNNEVKEEAWDYDNMLDSTKNHDDAWIDMEDYLDLEEIGNLEEWWNKHYDKKGLAFSLEFHKNILDDYQKMKANYNNSAKHYNRTPIKLIKQYNSNTVEVTPDLSKGWLESENEKEAKDEWEDNIFYYLDCVDAYHFKWDDNKFYIYYGNDVFKTGY